MTFQVPILGLLLCFPLPSFRLSPCRRGLRCAEPGFNYCKLPTSVLFRKRVNRLYLPKMSKARPGRPPPPAPKPGIVKIFCIYVIYDHIILYSSPQTSYDRVSILNLHLLFFAKTSLGISYYHDYNTCYWCSVNSFNNLLPLNYFSFWAIQYQQLSTWPTSNLYYVSYDEFGVCVSF